MRGSRTVVIIALATSIAGLASPARAATAPNYTDLSGHWARSAITYTAVQRTWLTVSGTAYKPSALMNRALFARALVQAFPPPPPTPAPSPSPEPDPLDVIPSPSPTPTPPPSFPQLTFTDVPKSTSLYRYANAAVVLGYLSAPGGTFNPSGTVTKSVMDRALIRGAGLTDLVQQINTIRTSDGRAFRHTAAFGYSVVASQLGFHFNYPNAAGRELVPSTAVNRADTAYALQAVATASQGWRIWNLQNYDIVLPVMSSTRRKVVEFAIAYANHPYVYANSSARGFDCSGYVWWVLKKGIGPTSRGYEGWSVPDRTSYDMAKNARPRIDMQHLRPLDIVTWDVEGANEHRWQGVGHAGIFLGNGWVIHSSGSKGGVSIDRVDQGYWHDSFVWGRRVVPSTA